ncbi:hypothetical protein Scep_022023 [Stephania cephalantha]|uniref:Uncharacterized protein n=1 Tax=Stephania cephalantha TaxID=152367 RepID=A0AAP0I2B4_9MAGN
MEYNHVCHANSKIIDSRFKWIRWESSLKSGLDKKLKSAKAAFDVSVIGNLDFKDITIKKDSGNVIR